MKLLILDGNSVINRAYFGVKPLTTREGLYTHAIYGFLNILDKLEKEEQPDAVCVSFDLHGPTFRHLKYDGYKATRHGMDEELRQLSSYHVTCEMRYVDSREETDRAVRELLAQKVDALILFMAGYPFDQTLCDQIHESGIPVFVSGDEVRELNAQCTIGVNGTLAGHMAADLLGLMLPAGSEAAVFIGSSGITVHTRKADAFSAAMQAFGHETAAVYETHDAEQQAAACMEQLLREHPHVKGIYIASATGGPIVERCRALPPEKRPVIVATDVYETLKTAMRDGIVAATIYQNQELMGRLSIRMAYEYLCGQNSYCMEQQEPVSRIEVNPRPVFRSGMAENAIANYSAEGELSLPVSCG